MDFNNGLIIQFCTCGRDVFNQITINLPISMSNKEYIVVTGFDNVSNSTGFRVSYGDKTPSSIMFSKIGNVNTTGYFAVFGY